MKRSTLYILAALTLGLLTYSSFGADSIRRKKASEVQIRAVLDSTADGWNRGDLRQYLAAYTETATEMGKNGLDGGRNVIEQTMRQGFWKTGRPLQHLHYEHVVVRMLGKDYALVTGEFVLTGGGKADRTGWFSTVWQRNPEGWRMIHDHS